MAQQSSTPSNRLRSAIVVALTAAALTVVQPQATHAGDQAAPDQVSPDGAATQSHGSTPPAFARRVPAYTTQVVRTVSSTFWCRRVYCTVTQAWQKRRGQWQLVRHFRSSIGPNGWNKQREGDNRSPTGVYRIKTTFSTGPRAPGPMLWKRRLPTSTVTNYPGRLYNTWVEERGRSDGDRPSMRYGFIVNYNHVRLRPGVGPKPLQGKGSGIFYHTSKPGHRWDATRGCTQVGIPENMRWLVRWLRPDDHPRVVQNL